MRNFPGCHKGQGATEYLILLAVVLIVALVSVALLGFFPGMAGDAQATQSKMYWASASPIAITEWAAKYSGPDSEPYLRVRNIGPYPIRITKILATNGNSISMIFTAGNHTNMSDFYYLAPGEEKYFAESGYFGVQDSREVRFFLGRTGSSLSLLYGASSVCTASGANAGTLIMPDFGFEYIQYIENTQITKRQIGAKPLVIKCT